MGATVTHVSPFSNLDVPVASTPIGRAVREKWVQPFYTPKAVDFLCRYLKYYLSKPDLWFDQEEAVGALLELDSKNGTNHFDSVAAQFIAFQDNHQTTIEECGTRFRIQLDAIEFIHEVVCK